MKTAFVCDSTLQVNEEFCKNYPLSIVPLEVRLDDELYEDNVTITPEEFYKKINSGMNRLGFNENEILKLIEKIKKYEINSKNNKLEIISIFSHLIQIISQYSKITFK